MSKKRYASSRKNGQSSVQRTPRIIEEKTNPVYASLVTYSDIPQPVMMPRNYKSFSKDGYATSDTLYKVINYITTNAAAIPPKLYEDATMETEIPNKHPLMQRLTRPNPEQSGVELREAMLGYFLIAGNAYLYAIRSGPKSPPDELWALQPDKVEIIPSKTRGIVGYKYTDFEQQIDPANIGRMKFWNPNNPLYGMSPIEAGAILIDMQTAAKKWNLALLQNMAKPPGAWVVPAGVNMGYPEREKLSSQLAQKMGGYANAGKPPVLDGGLDWKQMGVSPSEMDWLESLKWQAGSIANLYNIAPQLIGDTAATTYENMMQAKQSSYTEEIFPTLDRFYMMLTNWLVPMYPDLPQTAVIYYDKTTVEVLQEVIQAQKDAESDRAIKAYMQGGCTLNECLIGQGKKDIGPDGEVYRIGAVLVPASKIMDYALQSMTKPAAPPIPAPEPIAPDPTVVPPATPPEGQQPPPKPKDSDVPPDKGDASPAKTETAKKALYRKAKGDDPVTHLLWVVDGNPCEFCLQNENAIIPADGSETFPNGCTGPEDSHKYCMCTVAQLSIPDDADTSDMSNDDLINWFYVGMLEARHAQDVRDRDAHRAAQQAQDSEDEEDESDVEYATPAPKPKPKPRKQRRDEYRQWMAATLR